ncbi:MAG TPA: xanthine dehydrogenase family protein subunit M [Ktedonobacteraceae bacterium]|nr:xanthine dehydrogenase family protein subunit M [Ktedonobacteraceae bacterium]
MEPFSYLRAEDAATAVAQLTAHPRAAYIAGGTTLLDLMKDNVLHPDTLVDITHLPLRGIEATEDGILIGSLTTMSEVARDALIRERYPVIAQALLASASQQLRNMATIGGNLLQHTRCSYYRDPVFACNKREPGTGCAALTGENRVHAILGTSSHCIATHGSDLAVALVALDAHLLILGPTGRRRIPLTNFYLLPGTTPEREHLLAQGELIVAIELPTTFDASRSAYLKIRDRASYEFALVSAAVALELDGTTIRAARLALGGVGTIPWRARAAEALLQGAPLSRDAFAAAAEAALSGAILQRDNAFKSELARHTLLRVLTEVGGIE